MDPGRVVYSDATPPLGIHAVGLYRVANEQWVPCIALMNEFAREPGLGEPLPASELPGIIDIVEVMADRFPRDLVIVEIQPPIDQYAVVSASLTGTLGVPARMSDGRTVALTAGHVAKTLNASVKINGTLVAEVIYSHYRQLHVHPEVCADVAVLALDDDWKDQVTVPSLSGIGSAAQLDNLWAYNRSGLGNPDGRPVRFAGERFPVNSTEGSWGDFIMVDPISEEGDSGSIVVNARGEIVGQIVGGRPGGYTIVQDIDYLLGDAQAVLDL